MGTSSGVYGQFSDVSQTTASVSDLTVGVRYYFAVTAYNEAGLESGYSEEVSAIVSPPDSTPEPPGSTLEPQYLLNISTRVLVRGGDHVMIGGFIIEGDSNKDIVFRALGPSLANLGVPRVLADPTLEVYDSTGTLIDQNDNWTTIPSGTVPAGFEPPHPAEAVVVASLAPGSYTAVLRSADGSAGNALCELYDLAPGNSTVRNISTRGEVGTGDDVMIGGFIIGGTTPTKIMVRAIGPSLAAFGVTGVLPDPVLELHDKDGSLIYQNDNWRAEQAQQIIDTTIRLPTKANPPLLRHWHPGPTPRSCTMPAPPKGWHWSKFTCSANNGSASRLRLTTMRLQRRYCCANQSAAACKT